MKVKPADQLESTKKNKVLNVFLGGDVSALENHWVFLARNFFQKKYIVCVHCTY